MKFKDKDFELINIPIKEFYISKTSDQNDIEKLIRELNANVEQTDSELKFYDFDNFTILEYMTITLKYRKIKFTRVFDINDNEILQNIKKD